MSRARPALFLMLGWTALLWALEVVDTVSGHALDTFGIRPRELSELADIVPAAFLHFGFGHLAANTLPLFVLGFLAALRTGVRRFVAAVALITVVSGLGVWLTAAPYSNTAGASGVVFGILGFLLVRGFTDRSLPDVLIGVGVLVVYGSLLWGVLPVASDVSWQGHLFGLVGGVLAAFLLRALPRSTARPAVSPVP
ncbi:rhomboid family intramembrane serine protease [Streptomyces sp. NBC_01525]|uniref:Rhomboid family intramembrane serine protease n=1 Tax=Streptomyces benahoarensis TaxID=2595054 RepID=A0A553ZP60_9ACTN|nr:rhomboid family intramembrane serine protease [Streptomyces benahoarensis]TSB29351.1 rhomboid family intramembrane serine protease [Streptomyces benahoarensis]TSB43250.1 rhomboid family intramembrane serine protease [Streptomyces benahoarensis]